MTYLILHSSTKSKAFDWPMSAKIIPRIGETIAIEGKYYTVFVYNIDLQTEAI